MPLQDDKNVSKMKKSTNKNPLTLGDTKQREN